MSNTITIELCAEDRARLDKIIEGLTALGKRPDCSKCVKDVATVMEKAVEVIDRVTPPQTSGQDDIVELARRALNPETEATPQEAPKIAQDEPKPSDHPTLDPFPEGTTETEGASETAETEEVPTVTVADLQHLVITLCRAKKQTEIKKILGEYGAASVAEAVKDESNIPGLYAKLKKLEG